MLSFHFITFFILLYFIIFCKFENVILFILIIICYLLLFV